MLLLGVRNLGLGGWMPAECMALENEVSEWQGEAEYTTRDNALRWVFACAWGGCFRLGLEGFAALVAAAPAELTAACRSNLKSTAPPPTPRPPQTGSRPPWSAACA
jgi:hypothetical protein